MNVKNITEYGKTCKFIVARQVDADLWYYGGYRSLEKAQEVAAEVDGTVIENGLIAESD